MLGTTVVEHIFANVEKLLPFQILKSYEMGVRWTLGKNPKAIGPGPHWRIPILHSITTENIVDEVFNMPTQTVVTKDGKRVLFSVNVSFRLNNIVAHECNVQDFNESLSGAIMTHLAKRVRESTLADLESPEGIKKLEDSLVRTLETKVKHWGVEINDVGFTDFIPEPRVYRLFMEQNMGAKSHA